MTRIRWEDEPVGYPVAIDGFVGPAAWNLRTFRIWRPDLRVDPRHFLTSDLRGQARKQCHGTPDELKAEAERWLEEFAASLGAVFPEKRDGTRYCPRDHKKWGRRMPMDRIPGGGWACPGILADGKDCGLELDATGNPKAGQ